MSRHSRARDTRWLYELPTLENALARLSMAEEKRRVALDHALNADPGRPAVSLDRIYYEMKAQEADIDFVMDFLANHWQQVVAAIRQECE